MHYQAPLRVSVERHGSRGLRRVVCALPNSIGSYFLLFKLVGGFCDLGGARDVPSKRAGVILRMHAPQRWGGGSLEFLFSGRAVAGAKICADSWILGEPSMAVGKDLR